MTTQELLTDLPALVEVPAPELTPMALMQHALDKGTDPRNLEILMDLHERFIKNRAEEAFAAAMHKCQSEMPKVVKDAQNKHTKSRYALLETVQHVARPVYSANGFSLSFGEADCPIAGFKRTICDVRHTAGACHRYHLDLPIDGVGAKGGETAMNAVQGCISTTSYAQRRLVCMIFCITIAGEDYDGNGNRAQDTITDEEIAILNEWLESSGEPLENILRFGNVDSLKQLPRSKFQAVIDGFKRRARP